MPRISFTVAFRSTSGDGCLGVLGDVRMVAGWMPFPSISPLRMRAGPPLNIGFIIALGRNHDPLPIVVARHGALWSGSCAFDANNAADADDLLVNLHLYLSIISVVKYLNVSGWLGGVTDTSGYWYSGSLPGLVRSLCGGRGLPSGLSNRTEGFLLGRFSTTLAPGEEPQDGLAAEDLTVLCDLLDMEGQ